MLAAEGGAEGDRRGDADDARDEREPPELEAGGAETDVRDVELRLEGGGGWSVAHGVASTRRFVGAFWLSCSAFT